MVQETKQKVQRGAGRTVGNLYDRLDAARQQRAEVLTPLEAANDDHRTSRPSRSTRPAFPTLKPARPETTLSRATGQWHWIVPWLLVALIVTLIFRFAVS